MLLFGLQQVMETDRMLYLVTEFASKGEIFGKRLKNARKDVRTKIFQR